MGERGFSDYVFEQLTVDMERLRRSSTYSLAGNMIEIPQESGVHIYDTHSRRFSVPAPVLHQPSRLTVQMLENNTPILRGDIGAFIYNFYCFG